MGGDSAELMVKEMTAEEEEEQLVMRRLRNSAESLRRGMRSLQYKV